MENIDRTDFLGLDDLHAVFFDFDDVLVQSLDIKAQAFMTLFDGRAESLKAKILDHFISYTGRSRQSKIRHVYEFILREPLTEEGLECHCQLFSERSLEAVIGAEEVRGSEQLLGILKQRNIEMFIVSGTPEIELQRIVEARGVTGLFREVRGTPVEKELNIAKLLENYRLDPANCLMVGDGTVDHFAAQYNQMPFVGVVKRQNPFPSEVPVVPDLEGLGRFLVAKSRNQEIKSIGN
jgi:phosphoglycolate phosphatase-like HAD superfamily hydrolase